LNDDIRLRFAGGGISPETVDAKDIAELVTQYCDCTRAIIRSTPGLVEEDVMVSLTEITNQSLGLGFKAKASLLAAHLIFTGAIRSGNIAHLPPPAQTFAKTVRTFTREKNCEAEFYDHGTESPTVVISKSSELNTEFDSAITGKILVYGKLERLGGKVPRAAVVSGEPEERYSCLITESMAKELASRLYELVGLECEADWNWNAQQGSELKVRNIVPYIASTPTQGFKALMSVMQKERAPSDWGDDE
jgi:hypothetical protein